MESLQRSNAELEMLLGKRQELLNLTKTHKLASADERLVTFRSQPVGIIARRPGSMLWFSTARTVPYYSIADASLSLVGHLWHVQQEEGPEGVKRELREARAQAERLIGQVQAEGEEAANG